MAAPTAPPPVVEAQDVVQATRATVLVGLVQRLKDNAATAFKEVSSCCAARGRGAQEGGAALTRAWLVGPI